MVFDCENKWASVPWGLDKSFIRRGNKSFAVKARPFNLLSLFLKYSGNGQGCSYDTAPFLNQSFLGSIVKSIINIVKTLKCVAAVNTLI